MKSVSSKVRMTRLEVILNKEGDYIKTILHQKSGVKELDDAAILAFKRGAPFLNPPQEMVQPDGKIHLHYSFNIYWSPKHIARSSN